MAQIQVLDSAVIDKIAAGEVVERPLSVVKELVENALDAGASAISVETKDGGIEMIRVTDNGSGIEADQVKNAFLRHATSKIRQAEDLDRIGSLGFRGEALSSIAAVSKVEIITKTKEKLTGVHFVLEGGKEKVFEEVGAPEGTTIIMRNLFFNTPVRRKFLKQPQTEGSYIAELMEHLALSRPDVSFKLLMNGQVRFHTSGNGDLKEVIYRIYGKEISSNLVEITASMPGAEIRGYLGKPQINRSSRNFETYFINRRYIRSSLIAKAVEEGYKQYLMQHKFPFVVLHFTVEPERVDVNVHPTKMDVRFTDTAPLYQFIVESVTEALKERELIPQVTLETAEERKFSATKDRSVEYTPEPFETRRNHQYRLQEETLYKAKADPTHGQAALAAVAKVASEIQIPAPVQTTQSELPPVQMSLFEDKMITPEKREEYQILGQIFDTYWLVALRDQLMIVDQHAAHEKVKYEALIRQFRERTVISQNLQPPIVVSLTAKEEQIVKEYRDAFAGLGFEIEEFGGKEYALRSVPTDLYGCGERQMFEEVLDQLAEGNFGGGLTVVEEKIASMACKAAVKGNQTLSVREMEALIDQLLTLENPYHCPHGRPTIISMSKYEIEKKFKRIVS
ncbi:MAG: DNA mismatch repair endonuclease MutL [Lachnospiraceae bacterium]|nr:DNA mismatch repair endonuclease MutL [Lachnospiraceae bacterium]